MALAASHAGAMELTRLGNAIVLSGPVNGGEWAQVKDAFAANPYIDLVILRNSHGGDAGTGYEIGEFFRQQGVTTAVSGYCISSCSRMFLGGKKRVFTDDYPLDQTRVGFHGHYNAHGDLNGASVIRGGLFDWIMKYSDGKADPDWSGDGSPSGRTRERPISFIPIWPRRWAIVCSSVTACNVKKSPAANRSAPMHYNAV